MQLLILSGNMVLPWRTKILILHFTFNWNPPICTGNVKCTCTNRQVLEKWATVAQRSFSFILETCFFNSISSQALKYPLTNNVECDNKGHYYPVNIICLVHVLQDNLVTTFDFCWYVIFSIFWLNKWQLLHPVWQIFT